MVTYIQDKSLYTVGIQLRSFPAHVETYALKNSFAMDCDFLNFPPFF